MKICGKKRCIFILLGIFLIIGTMGCIMFYGHSLDSIFGTLRTDVESQALMDGAKDYLVTDNEWKALSDDAWIILDSFPKGKVKGIELDIEMLDNMSTEVVQIYYSRGEEIDGNLYVEAALHQGQNYIDLEADTILQSIRLDLTSHKDASFRLNKVSVCYTSEKQVVFWIITPLLVLFFSVFTLIWKNNIILTRIYDRKPKVKRYIENAEQVWSLAYSDFLNRFSGSYLGFFWGVFQPLATILLFWFVFQVGFRSNPIDDVPFILWLSAGMIPWNYFYDAWSGGTSTFLSYNYIVKKVVFNVELLPIIKSISSAILNFIFNIILLVIYTLYGEFPGYHIIDMIYFSFCVMALSLGLSYITATLNVFIKDIGQFLGIALQFLMWLTPMMWDYHMLENISWFYKLNPLHYIINGYREALINGNWFFHHWVQMIWFWFITITCIVVGKIIMKKMKAHFADVL